MAQSEYFIQIQYVNVSRGIDCPLQIFLSLLLNSVISVLLLYIVTVFYHQYQTFFWFASKSFNYSSVKHCYSVLKA